MAANHIETGARLEQYIKHSFSKQKQFAELYGIGKSFVSLMVTGRSPVPLELMQKLAIAKPALNLHWLLTGAGEMIFEPGEEGEPQHGRAVVEEPEAVYETGIGVLERMQRAINEVLERVAALESQQAMSKQGT